MDISKIGIGEYKSIREYVESKLNAFEQLGLSMETLFSLMFRESDNIMYERSSGYRIESFTYGEVKEKILKRAATLHSLLCDIEKGSVVGLSQDNSLSWIENFWGIIICGYNPMLINLRLSSDMVETALSDANAKAVVSDSRTYSVLTVMDKDIVEAEKGYMGDGFATEILVMTSGTTRHVKLCAYTAEELYHQIRGSYSIINSCKLIQEHCENRLKLLCFLPFYHAFGLVAVYIWFSFFSRTFVELKDMAPQTIVGTVKRHKVTHIFAVPLFWEKVYEQAIKTIRSRGEATERKFDKAMKLCDRLGDSKLSSQFSKLAFKEVRENLFGDSIRFLITGGSSISYEAMRFFNNIGYHLSDGYGMSEIGITSVELSNKKSILNERFIGKPMDGVTYKIDENGILLAKGPALAKYIIEDGIRKDRDDNAFFYTNDLAECIDGHYRVLGRKDDLVIGYSGENLNPNLIEPRLLFDKNIRGVCLIGARSATENVPTLIVSVNKFISRDIFTALDSALKRRLSELNLSSEIRAVVYTGDSLLAEDEFKLNRLRIRDVYESNGFKTLSPLDPEDKERDDELSKKLKSAFAAALSKTPEEIHESANFFTDLGGSSLDYFAMISEMSEELSIAFPSSGDSVPSTVREFYDYINDIR